MSRTHRSRVTVEVPVPLTLRNYRPPPGFELIGAVMAADYGGALIRSKHTGIYCAATTEGIRSLPQRKIIAALEATRNT